MPYTGFTRRRATLPWAQKSWRRWMRTWPAGASAEVVHNATVLAGLSICGFAFTNLRASRTGTTCCAARGAAMVALGQFVGGPPRLRLIYAPYRTGIRSPHPRGSGEAPSVLEGACWQGGCRPRPGMSSHSCRVPGPPEAGAARNASRLDREKRVRSLRCYDSGIASSWCPETRIRRIECASAGTKKDR